MRFNDSVVIQILLEIQQMYLEKFNEDISIEDLFEIINEGQIKFTALCIESKIDIKWSDFGKFEVSSYKIKQRQITKKLIDTGVERNEAIKLAKEKTSELFLKNFRENKKIGDANYFKEILKFKQDDSNE